MVFINASQGSIKITGSVREDGGGDHNTTSLFRQKMEKEPGYKDRKTTYTNYRKGKTHTKAKKEKETKQIKGRWRNANKEGNLKFSEGWHRSTGREIPD